MEVIKTIATFPRILKIEGKQPKSKSVVASSNQT